MHTILTMPTMSSELTPPPTSELTPHPTTLPPYQSTKKSEAFKGIDVLCKEFFIAAPLAGQLHSDTMRRRHWVSLGSGSYQ